MVSISSLSCQKQRSARLKEEVITHAIEVRRGPWPTIVWEALSGEWWEIAM